MIEVHCHILPGIDDGAPDLEASLAMARAYVAGGIDIAVATPHFKESLPGNVPGTVRTAVARLQAELDARAIPLSLLPGAEYAWDDRLFAVADGRAVEVMTYGDRGRHLLLEFPHLTKPAGLLDVLFSIQTRGFVPVIAHIDRYPYFGSEPVFEQLKERGCMLQWNLKSIARAGLFGRRRSREAARLVERGLPDMAGIDAHHVGEIEVALSVGLDRLSGLADPEYIASLTGGAAAAMLGLAGRR